MNFTDISTTINRALTAAGLNPKSTPFSAIHATIQRAFKSAGVAPQTHPERSTAHDDEPTASNTGQFVTRRHTGAGGSSREYKLYIPSTLGKTPPLIVMLHGCKQNPDDFANGTRMNELAEEHGFLVAYPAQTSNANGSNCWNWFRPIDQGRESGEPSIVAGIAEDVARDHAVDKRRIFVAGLSAGAAMAVILGKTYPDVFKGVGAHSGLPYAAARDVATAFGAMHGAPAGASAGAAPERASARVPTIVFHGDHDRTVVRSNGDAIVAQAIGGFEAAGERLRVTKVSEGASATSRGYTSTVYASEDGNPCVETWVLHGGAHAWSGGSSAGSFTDTKGPDASREMVRFFLAR